jgi:formylglycine-generating enzyme required for sulfatase activity
MGQSQPRVAASPSGPTAPVNPLAATSASDSQFVGSRTAGAVSEPSKPRGSGLWVGIGALAIAGIAAGAYFAFRSPPSPSSAASASASSLAANSNAPPSPSGVAATPTADTHCPAGMIYHASGKMIMGAKDGGRDDTRPTHQVTLTAYCLDRTEVTAGAYQDCINAGVCEKPPASVNIPGITDKQKEAFTELCTARHKELSDHPINCVDWDMADKYCKWAKKRLPTEAEWEYAARGVEQRDFPWGDEKPDETRLNACGAECLKWGEDHLVPMKPMYPGDDGFAGTAPVGHYPAGSTKLGEVDLAGNVWEWTADYYGTYSPDPVTDPKGPEKGAERVIRGGAFNGSEVDWAKPSYRYRSAPDTYNHAIGFRCAAAALQ